jgi:uncharacterized membrane protein
LRALTVCLPFLRANFDEKMVTRANDSLTPLMNLTCINRSLDQEWSVSMDMLIAAALAWLGLHFVVSGSSLRDVLVRAAGEQAYLGLYSLASVGGIVWLSMAYNAALSEGLVPIWDLGAGVSHMGLIVVAIAFVFGLPGVMMPSPTGVGQGALAGQASLIRGPLRITRHPFLWSVALWAAFHLAANGDQASAIFFGTWLVLAIGGTFSIDAKRARALGPQWASFAQATSNVPFAAILAGRQKFVLSELLGWRQGVALAIFAGVALSHAWLFGVSPFPGGWVPF